MNTGEDVQGLRKILDFTRLISIAILCLHFYLECYHAFASWGWTASISDRIMYNISKTGLFSSPWNPKLAALLFLAISLLGVKGRKDEKIRKNSIAIYLMIGLLIYFVSTLCLYITGEVNALSIFYIVLSGIGYLLMLIGGGQLSRLIKAGMVTDVFNSDNETFPQEERLLENEYSINLPALYKLKGKVRRSFINILNPFRAILLVGSPGSRRERGGKEEPEKVTLSSDTSLINTLKKAFPCLSMTLNTMT
jgi:hypothetical protein